MEFLSSEWMGHDVWLWCLFITAIGALLVLDLKVLNRGNHEISVKQSLTMCGFYMALACAFGVWVWMTMGANAGANFFTGYFVELSLSMDNLFIMALIFMHFSIPAKYQHRVLFWGIMGVIVLRGIMIGAGSMIISQFDWILLVFGAFLMFTGIRMLFMKDDDEKVSFEDSRILAFLKKHMHVTMQIENEKFFVRKADEQGVIRRYATPLFLSLCLIEISDVIFAVDSIPAIFVITTDPFIIFTSNMFAILGLRSLFFALSAVLERFAYMKYALALILAFIGAEIFYDHYVGNVAPILTFGVTVFLLVGGAAISLAMTKGKTAETN